MKLFWKLIVLLALMTAVACSSPANEETTADPTAPAAAAEELPTETAVPPTNTPAPTNTPPPVPTAMPEPVLFTAVNPADQPMLPRPDADSPFDSIYTDVGAVIYHEGLFHLFYNAIHGWPPREILIGYATSPDGINWTREVDEPLFQAEDVSYSGHTLLVSSALVEDDGNWVLYFYSWPSMSTSVTSAIGRITAPGPTGPWTADEAPALEVSIDGWDNFSVANPYVVQHDDGTYYMYYTGLLKGNLESSIGLATSADGITWTKHEEPVLLTGDAPWSERKISGPKVLATDEDWLMIYRNDVISGAPRTLGYATSPDGITWTHTSQETPVLDVAAYEPWRAVWSTDIAQVSDTYFLFLEIGNGSSTDLHVTTYEGMFGE
jgi:predicted GH43/DUF377 family glycosyl hydrolase